MQNVTGDENVVVQNEKSEILIENLKSELKPYHDIADLDTLAVASIHLEQHLCAPSINSVHLLPL